LLRRKPQLVELNDKLRLINYPVNHFSEAMFPVVMTRFGADILALPK